MGMGPDSIMDTNAMLELLVTYNTINEKSRVKLMELLRYAVEKLSEHGAYLNTRIEDVLLGIDKRGDGLGVLLVIRGGFIVFASEEKAVVTHISDPSTGLEERFT